MKNVLVQAAENVHQGYRKRKWWHRVVSMMTAVVVFCTTYALILPALTMEGDAICGFEAHEHTEGCYARHQIRTLACGEDGIHSHGSLCYDDTGALTCPLPEINEHTHTDACETTETVTVCGLEETPGHTHDDVCSPTQTVLICEQAHDHGESCYTVQYGLCLEPETQAHAHTDACWEQRQTITCTAHQHTVDCLAEETVEELVCDTPIHIHADSCFPSEESDSFSKYLCGSGEHAHIENCYDGAGVLTCSIPAHTHEAACLVADLDLTAGVENQRQWEQTLEAIELTGSWPADLLAVAESQLGYTENEKNVILAGDDLKGITRYGQWYGDPYGEWCAMFVSFCLHYAGVADFPLESGCTRWIEDLTEEGIYAEAGDYTPKAGDVIFFDFQQKRNSTVCIPVDADHVGIVAELIPATETQSAKIRTIEGNTGGKVAYRTYEADDPTIVGYGILPQQMYYCGQRDHIHTESCTVLTAEYFQSSLPLICTIADHVHTAACYDTVTADFTYEDDRISLAVHVVSHAGIPEGVTMKVTELDSGGQAYASYEDYASRNSGSELLSLVGYEIRFFLAGEEIELADASITAELMVKQMEYSLAEDISVTPLRSLTAAIGAMFTAEAPAETEASEEIDSVVVVTVLQEDEAAVSESGSFTVDGGTAEGTVVKLELGTGRTLALASATAPTFKVEYYANLPLFVSSKTKLNEYMLQVIDTTTTGTGTGGDLPSNVSRTETGTRNGYVYLQLAEYGTADQNNTGTPLSSSTAADVDGKSYRLASQITLTQIYDTDTISYVPGMDTINLNKIRENDHYDMAEVWVSQDGGSTFESYGAGSGVDHQVSSLANITFTNNADAADPANGIIAIGSNTVIRFVYNVLQGSFSNSVNFFDYDISDGVVQDAPGYPYATYDDAVAAGAGTVYMNTYLKGINNMSNYVSSSTNGAQAYFAFGNNNTNTGLGEQTLNGASINKFNEGFKGCSFGLVKDYDILTNTLTYADGIAYQPLFNDEMYYRFTQGTKVQGKETYTNNYLDFLRFGDTYILDSVNGAGAINGITERNLSEFFVPNVSRQYSTKELLFTNNFWPMDGTAGDDVAGKDMVFGEYYNFQNKKKLRTNGTGSTGNLTLSDDHNDHNSYFGLQYAVEFHLDGHYCGPLEYLFYGDDDMWVFLTDLSNGDTQLICDIGGVHSSVGSYTDLWDYITHETVGDFVLTFFYTERGSSGSSCFMAFTLPQITSITQNTPETGSVSVTKETTGVQDSGAEFEFKFELSTDDPSIHGVSDNYSYMISGGGDPVVGLISTGKTFKIKAGQTFSVSGIPAGMTYTITEQTGSGYDVSWEGHSGGSTVTGTIISDKVAAGQTHTLVCNNLAVGSLTIEKLVEGTTTTKEFILDVTLSEPDGSPLSGTFSGYTFDENGYLELPITADQKITISGIPAGTVVNVAEQDAPGYNVTYQVNGSGVEVASATITHGGTTAVTVVNTTEYELPSTGGAGSLPLAFGGLLILAAALMYVIYFGRKRQKGGV